MERLKKYNIIVGWLVFFVAAFVYLSTIEPTVSWWDCGEYIATTYKLEVGHPPGAPFFQIVGRLFASLAFGDLTKVAMMVNAMSAIASAFTILFLFWSITYFAKRIIIKSKEVRDGQIFAILGSGVVGALAYTFSDSFWFSAVEGEVYAMSSFYTAIVFWAILKWDEEADTKYAYRWILLIAFLIGQSIGVHLLNLLAIPAIALVIYFRKYTFSWKGFIITLGASLAVLLIIMSIIVQAFASMAYSFDYFMVNELGLPFNYGSIFFVALFTIILAYGIYYSEKQGKRMLNLSLLSLAFIMIGYSSYFMIVIRAEANTPINENMPKDVLTLRPYLAREQYGSRPLLTGHYYNAPYKRDEVGNIITEDGDPIYIKDVKTGKYVMSNAMKGMDRKYDDRFNTIFPRLWSPDPKHVRVYKTYGKGKPIRVKTGEKTKIIYKPTFFENIKFFLSYQVNHMYFRYLMWNFSGRQNEIESQGEINNGNWITGIDFIDENLLGLPPQDNLPKSMQSKAHNEYYMLPFLLGLLGAFFQFNRNKEGGYIVLTLFVLTGFAIIVYLNQTPMQPRERDYAFVGSFYAFAIWIGLGVLAVFEGVRRFASEKPAAIIATAMTLLLVPGIMAKENWDDHDRSGKYATLDWAKNYLNSCEPNAIVITNGDNDTFPLWYAQEVEGIRRDVRVVNYMLASGYWYIQQMMEKKYESDPLPLTLSKEQYEHGTNMTLVVDDRIKGEYPELKDVIRLVSKELKQLRYMTPDGELPIFPSSKLSLKIDSADMVRKNAVPEYMRGDMVKEIRWKLKGFALYKNDLFLLDLIATNDWKRPIYFVSPNSVSDVLNISKYAHLTGTVSRLLPVKAKHYTNGFGGVDIVQAYENLMRFDYGNLANPDVYIDRESARNIYMTKLDFLFTAEALMEANEKEKAVKLLDKYFEAFPVDRVIPDIYMIQAGEIYADAGADDKSKAFLKVMMDNAIEDIDYINRLTEKQAMFFEDTYREALGTLQRILMLARDKKYQEIQKVADSVFTQEIGNLKD
jgi:hypothetical protein